MVPVHYESSLPSYLEGDEISEDLKQKMAECRIFNENGVREFARRGDSVKLEGYLFYFFFFFFYCLSFYYLFLTLELMKHQLN